MSGNNEEISISVFRNRKWHTETTRDPDKTFIRDMTVTPDMASDWLATRNTQNRRMKDGQVRKIARAIRANKWYETGNYISFYRDGALADGQNRLKAVVEAATPIKTRVVFGVKPEAKMHIDTGKARTLSDRSKLSGHDYTTKMLTVSRFLMEMDEGRKTVFDDEIMAFLRTSDVTVRLFADLVNARYMNKAPAVAGLVYLALENEQREAVLMEFATRYNSGIGFDSEGDPAYRLRQFASERRESNTGAFRKELFYKTIAAAKAFLDGRKLKRLYAEPEHNVDVASILPRRRKK